MASAGQTTYDKLKKMNEEEKTYDFKCPYCKSDNILLSPLNVSYKHTIDNIDIKNIMIKNYLDKLPLIQDALLIASNMNDGNVGCDCKKCNQFSRVFDKINAIDLKKWIKKNIGDKPFIL